jgi:sigma-B regulation protein RsbU (phosphoserine phosphatase)
MYLSAFCGLMDFRKMMMKYSNHGHPPQCVYHLSGSFVQELPAQTAMLGLPMEDAEVYQDEIKLGAGDRILLFTDGVTEAASKSGEMYGESRLEGFFRDNHALIPEDFNQRLLMDLEAFSGAENFKDDIFILNIALKAHHGLFHLGR